MPILERSEKIHVKRDFNLVGVDETERYTETTGREALDFSKLSHLLF